MADVFFSITGSTGPNFAGTIVTPALTDVVNSVVPTSIIVSTPFPFSFAPDNVQLYDNGTGLGDYVTWRTYAGGSQYPDSGESLDVWSTGLTARINGGDSWSAIIAFNGGPGAGVYQLQTDKYSTLYNYDSPFGRWYGYAGTITFTS